MRYNNWLLEALCYKQTDTARAQRIRYWAEKNRLVPRKRRGMWFFTDFNNCLVSPETGMDDLEALRYLSEEN